MGRGGEGFSKSSHSNKTRSHFSLYHGEKAIVISHLPVLWSFSQLVQNSEENNNSTLLGPSNPNKWEEKFKNHQYAT